MRPKVYVVGRDFGITDMFLRRGWEVVQNIGKEVDLIQFTGGEDVDPSYYQETRHPRTYSNPARDAAESAIYHEWMGKIPMAGICRGGQFLNVMNGGKMWQHVDGHAGRGKHFATNQLTGEVVEVTSTHHQMMVPSEHGEVILTANMALRKESADAVAEGDGKDVEAVLYISTSCLCFQPHPEYVQINHPCQNLYFDYLTHILKD